MDGAGSQFLAGSGFSQDQYRGVGLRGTGDFTLQLAKRQAVADHMMVRMQLRLQTLILRFQPFQLKRVLHRHGGELRDGHQKLQVRLPEHRAFQIDHAAGLPAYH